MVVYSVFTQNVSTTYKTTLCSKSTLFLIIISFFTFFLPLLIAYRSQGFWVKQLSYREQPFVHFKQHYFLYIETENENGPIVCTTLLQSLDLLNQCTSIRANEMDNNGDGKLDGLELEVDVATQSDQSIHSVYLLLFFDYILQHQCLLQMESIAVVQSNSALTGKKLEIVGDLEFVQKTLLPCRGRDLRYNQSSFSSEIDLDIADIVKENAARNVSTRIANSYPMWTRGRPGDAFNLRVHIHYPEVTVAYRPGFWPVMKWAWVQYLPILVLFVALSRWVKGYVFLNHLLPTVPYAPWKKQL